jgi:P-type Cu+ transporter
VKSNTSPPVFFAPPPPPPPPRARTAAMAPPIELFCSVTGMDCASCSARVEDMLRGTPGVASFTVSLFSGNARIRYTPPLTTPLALLASIRQLGFGAEELAGTSSATLHVEVRPASALEATVASLSSLAGVTNVKGVGGGGDGGPSRAASFLPRLLWGSRSSSTRPALVDVVYDPTAVGARDLLAARISWAGAEGSKGGKTGGAASSESSPLLARGKTARTTPAPRTAAPADSAVPVLLSLRESLPDSDAETVRAMWWRLGVGGVCAASATVLAYVLGGAEDGGTGGRAGEALDAQPIAAVPLLTVRAILQFTLSLVTLVYVGGPIFVQAYLAAVYSKVMTMDTLVSASSLAAFVYSLGMIAASAAGAERQNTSPPIFETSTILLALVALGRTIEHAAKKRTASALRQLASAADTQAMLVVRAGSSTAGEAGATPPSSSSSSCCKPDGTCTKREADGGCEVSTAAEGASGSSSSMTTTWMGEDTILPLSPALLHLRDTVRVSPGCVFPADGVIERGETSVDESSVTGESRPVPKAPGDAVLGGAVNGEGVVTVLVTALPGAGTLARIVRLIEEAQGQRPALQLVADRVASIFTPAIFAASIGAFALWYGLASAGVVDTRGSPPGTFALLFALALLVVSCPCAISLAVPTASMVATLVGARVGLLVKGGPALEAAASVTHVVLDKTGTLTAGSPAIRSVHLLAPDRIVGAAAKRAGLTVDLVAQPPASSSSSSLTSSALGALTAGQAAALALAAEAEAGATHPFATALVGAAAQRLRVRRKEAGVGGVSQPPVSSSSSSSSTCGKTAAPVADVRTSVPGKGVRAVLLTAGGGTSSLAVGKLSWVLSGDAGAVEADDEEEAVEAAAEMERKGLSVLAVAADGALLALIGASDEARPESADVVRFLHERGVSVWIASGDNEGAVQAAAAAVGIPAACAVSGLTPEGKARLVESLRTTGTWAGGRGAAVAAASGADEESSAVKGWTTPMSTTTRARTKMAARVVMMVGDGINDAVALTAADIGVAMGGGAGAAGKGPTAATAVAMDAADVVLQRPDLGSLATLLRLASATRTRIRWNFGWAFVYNVVAMPLAGGAFYSVSGGAVSLPPGVAGISELFSSVPVVLGSLLLYAFDASGEAWRKELSSGGKREAGRAVGV